MSPALEEKLQALTQRELDTVLAALRYWQWRRWRERVRAGGRFESLLRIADGKHRMPLDDVELDRLCEDLNAGKRVVALPACA